MKKATFSEILKLFLNSIIIVFFGKIWFIQTHKDLKNYRKNYFRLQPKEKLRKIINTNLNKNYGQQKFIPFAFGSFQPNLTVFWNQCSQIFMFLSLVCFYDRSISWKFQLHSSILSHFMTWSFWDCPKRFVSLFFIIIFFNFRNSFSDRLCC